MIFVVLIVNLLISIFNAYQTGKVWIESKVIGGWIRALVWCGAIQSAIGFTFVYAYVVATIAMSIGFITEVDLTVVTALVYLAIIIPALGTGCIIMIQSWIVLFRERSLVNLSVTAWNTIANISNTYHAVTSFSDVLSLVKDVVFDDDFDGDSVSVRIMFLAVLGIFMGVITTYILINMFMRIPEKRAIDDF